MNDKTLYRRLLLINILFFIIVGVVVWNINVRYKDETASLPVPPDLSGINSTSTPSRLSIPSIHVNALVQMVGITKSGNMAVPTNYTDVGWYDRGYYPGTPGNAVIAGHLDNGPSVPAVFWHLGDMKIGDEVDVVNAAGQTLVFKVTGESLYSPSNAPLQLIFGSSTEAHLNLITCDGVWDEATHMYDKRLIVFTDFQGFATSSNP